MVCIIWAVHRRSRLGSLPLPAHAPPPPPPSCILPFLLLSSSFFLSIAACESDAPVLPGVRPVIEPAGQTPARRFRPTGQNARLPTSVAFWVRRSAVLSNPPTALRRQYPRSGRGSARRAPRATTSTNKKMSSSPPHRSPPTSYRC